MQNLTANTHWDTVNSFTAPSHHSSCMIKSLRLRLAVERLCISRQDFRAAGNVWLVWHSNPNLIPLNPMLSFLGIPFIKNGFGVKSVSLQSQGHTSQVTLGLAGPHIQIWDLSREGIKTEWESWVLVLEIVIRATGFQKCQIPDTDCGSELSIKLLIWKQICLKIRWQTPESNVCLHIQSLK